MMVDLFIGQTVQEICKVTIINQLVKVVIRLEWSRSQIKNKAINL
jgi:hypothetical protein